MKTQLLIGIDLGSKRIGVAVTDRSGTIASPLLVLQRSGDRRADHRRIDRLDMVAALKTRE